MLVRLMLKPNEPFAGVLLSIFLLDVYLRFFGSIIPSDSLQIAHTLVAR
jgi:hypothetical protein